MKKPAILFDIDGTLLTTAGAGQQAMVDAVVGRLETKSWQDKIAFSGRTDRGILGDVFAFFGVDPTAENYRKYTAEFLPTLEAYLPRHPGCVLPAVTLTLDCLRSHSHVVMGLLTGNMREAARLKLEHYGLADYFATFSSVVGGFGDKQADRDDVAREALESVQASHPEVEPQEIWIIGDTPNDVKCARAIGANVLALATGSYSRDALAACEPDLLADDLTDATPWWDLLESRYGVLRPAELSA